MTKITKSPAGELTDAELLARFQELREESAFAELVRRHGPMVLATAMRLLSNPHDAEDVLQATFMAFANHAGRIRRGEAVGAWLHIAAKRGAMRLGRTKAREQQLVTEAEVMIESTNMQDQPLSAELLAILDEEIDSLPAELQGPIVACDLEGLSQRDAAKQMGISTSTINDRIAKAHDLLKAKLTRRGVTLSAAGLATQLQVIRASAGTLSPMYVESISTCSVAFAAGAKALEVSPIVLDLATGVTKMMFPKLTNAALTAIIFISALIAASFGFRDSRASASSMRFGSPAPLTFNEVGRDHGSSTVSPDGLAMYLLVGNSTSGPFETHLATRPNTSAEFSTPVLVNPGNFFQHPDFSADGLALYGNVSAVQGDGIVVVRRNSIGEAFNFANAQMILNTNADERWATTSPDQLELYYTEGGIVDARIWVAKRTSVSDDFGMAMPVPGQINDFRASAPELSADGLTLLFESDRPGGFGGGDIWISKRETINSPWGAPMNAGSAVNTAADEWQPDITSDGSSLYFSRDVDPTSQVDFDLWRVAIIPEPATSTLAIASCLFLTGVTVRFRPKG